MIGENLEDAGGLRCPACSTPSLVAASGAARNDHAQCATCNGCFWIPVADPPVVYLDQWAWSLLRNPGQSGKNFEFWRSMLRRLLLLTHWRVITCPYSVYHEADSGLKPAISNSMRAVVHNVSNGAAFRDPDIIELRQLATALVAFERGAPAESIHCPRTDGVSVDADPLEQAIIFGQSWVRSDADRVRCLRDRDRLQIEWTSIDGEVTKVDLNDLDKLGRGFVQGFAVDALRDYLRNGIARDYTRQHIQMVHRVVNHFRPAFTLPEMAVSRAEDFLFSEYFAEMPCFKIAGLLIAACCRKNKNGGASDKGDFGDINFLRWYVPYCDAMLIDNSFRALATNAPINLDRRYSCRLFSSKTRDEFAAWLDEQENKYLMSLVPCSAAAPVPP